MRRPLKGPSPREGVGLATFDARAALAGLEEASSRPLGEAAGVDAVQLARDVLLSEQEFRRSGEYLSGQRAAEESRGFSLGDFAKGLGWGSLGLAGVVPVGGIGKLGKLDDVLGAARAAERARVGRVVPAPERGLEVVERVGRVPEAGVGRVQASLLRPEGGVFEADLPGVRVQELAGELAQRQVDSPLGLAAVEPREIAAALNSVPEFRQFLRMYRDTVSTNRRAGSFSGVSERPDLLEFARRAGAGSPSRVGRGPEMSLDASLAGVQGDRVVGSPSVQAAALNLGTRLRNSSIFLADDIYTPSFYVEFNRILGAVEGRTGMPPLTFSNGLAAASAQAAPYDEMLRLRRVAPMLEYRNGRAYFPTVEEIEALGAGNHPLYPRFKPDGTPGAVDSMAVMAGRGMADSINNPNLLDKPIFGLAAKTMPYAYLRYDPAYGLAYVSDTVDGLGQFLIRGDAGKIGTTEAKKAVQNQFAGRMLAEIYGVPASNVQEAIWAYIRVARDGFLRPKKDGWASDAIAPAFRGGAGSAENVLVEAVEAMDPRLVRMARENHERFVSGVRSGDELGWQWDAAREQPVIESATYLIRPSERVTGKGQPTAQPALQQAMLQAVQSSGPVLRERLLALATATGISLAALVEALGESGNDIPVEVLNA